jgi:hypothetical protein
MSGLWGLGALLGPEGTPVGVVSGAASACGVLTPACVWVVVLVGWGVVVC